MDDYSLECLGIYPDKSVKGEDVVCFMEQITRLNETAPERIQVDNIVPLITKHRIRYMTKKKINADFLLFRGPKFSKGSLEEAIGWSLGRGNGQVYKEADKQKLGGFLEAMQTEDMLVVS